MKYEACRPYRLQEKGSVEDLVGWVKSSFFEQRRFVDREDRDRQRAWLVGVNTAPPSRTTRDVHARSRNRWDWTASAHLPAMSR
jgi:transposase